MAESLASYCIRNGLTWILDQWDREANAPLTPGEIPRGSGKKVWWRCSQGHRWQAAVFNRSGRQVGCPYCDGRRLLPGQNDLATVDPELAAQWHPTRNGDLTPGQVLPGSGRKVWWQCRKGHSWQAAPKTRRAGSGCPYCAGHRVVPGQTDLATRRPALAAQWDWEANGDLTPDQVPCGSQRRVWWQCAKGHRWQASILSRTQRQAGCPYCAGRKPVPGETDLATVDPELAAQWDWEANAPWTPRQVSLHSSRKMWWRCGKGHRWQATINARAVGNQCPYCAGRRAWPGFNDLATLNPVLAAQWAQDLNGDLTPAMVTPGSRKKVWWRCSEGHVWKAVVYSRGGASHAGCPVCAGLARRKTEPVAGEPPLRPRDGNL